MRKVIKLLIKIFIILLFLIGMTDKKYQYNKNGRVITPNRDVILQLPEDGGELWNRLIFESSPYLLQHSANPVDWYPWGEEAFKIAKELDKPIFLSIGYTTCHWCHVMEHESFEDRSVATLMNDAFINIKVDREERPDIDNIYMSVTQMLTGRGGWPMTIIMTPSKEPFFAGTYFPKNTRYSRIGMLELVPKIKKMWETPVSRDSLISNADEIKRRLLNINRSVKISGEIDDDVFDKTFQNFEKNYDKVFGGFGKAPKFPKPHDYMFLLNYYYRTNNENALNMVKHSLDNMREGGIYDQIGFGFHRYSTDSKWLTPHFEKMLYDQALLIHAYLDAYIATGETKYSNVVHEIIEYVLRDMTLAEGGFYSAEDADSEGEEGIFYIWKREELIDVLGKDNGEFMINFLNIKEKGNWKDGMKNGTNIPHRTKTWEAISNEYKLNINESKNRYEKSRQQLFEYREKRTHPQKDDKILTDWNGLMISAIAKAASVLNDERYKASAIDAMNFIESNLTNEEGRLLKRIRPGSGPGGLDPTIEDYSFLIWGIIELYNLTFDPKYLELATFYSDHLIEHFLDKNDGSFYFTPDYGENLIIRSKDFYDGAIPSGNSVAAYNFIRLARLLSKPDYEDISVGILTRYSKRLNRSGSGQTMMMKAVDFQKGPSYEIIICGNKESDKSNKMLQAINTIKQPNKVVIWVDDKNKSTLEKIMPFIKYFSVDSNDPVVYVCQDYSCQLPTTDISKVIDLLN